MIKADNSYHVNGDLKAAGFRDEYDIKLISQCSLGLVTLGVGQCVDKFCPEGVVFLLTFSADGVQFISPPYNKGSHSPMSWREWFTKVHRGDRLSLLNRAPWAQAKFINVAME